MGRGMVAALAAGLVGASCAPSIPENSEVDEVRWLAQNWSGEERFWFHHATQGTSTLPVPYDWFMALERPHIALFGSPGMLADADYLRRFGFIPSGTGPDPAAGGQRRYGRPGAYDPTAFPGNPDSLPVGFARTRAALDPGAEVDQIGFTCAACHTGQLEYNGVSLRIDGGPAITDLGKFRETLGLALVYTRYVPGRFSRFADRVLGEDAPDAARDRLDAQLDALLERGDRINKLQDAAWQARERETGRTNVEEGFGRLDALNRIGNQVFFSDLLDADGFDASANLALNDAPVAYPHIWGAPWFAWVQYDASIEQPMVRNAGEALGVSARVNLRDPGAPLYESSVQVLEIHAMEQLLAGDNPHQGAAKHFRGLLAPEWPADLLGALDPAKVRQGRALYREMCQACHLPPVDDPAFWSDRYWTPANGAGERYLKLREITLDHIGTDPAQARVLATRTVQVPAYLGLEPGMLCGGDDGGVVTQASFATALAAVVEKTVTRWYDDHNIPEAEREQLNGNRPNCVKARSGYKARPLDGIWATAPFLHNGSVPTLYDLLLPADRRPETFCLGSRQFDPERVGYSTDCASGTFELDTRTDGNSNAGHEFRDGPRGNGVIGRALTDDERWALIEFLKSTRTASAAD